MEEKSKKITYESLWKAIIRPPGDYYLEEDFGPTNFKFHYKTYIRKDFDLIDFSGLILKVSIVEPDPISRPFDIMPIMPMVIYVHANSSSRVEGINIKKNLLKKDINICSFDFEGPGNSEGDMKKNSLKMLFISLRIIQVLVRLVYGEDQWELPQV